MSNLEQKAFESANKAFGLIEDMDKEFHNYHQEAFKEGYTLCQKEYEEKLRWIPVEEKLPKDNILVEVLNESCTPKYSYSVLKKRMWVNPYLNVYISPVPTHWRHIL